MSSSASPSSNGPNPPAVPREFSLVQGGLLYRLLCWARLSDAALLNMRTRVMAIALLAWLPLLLL